MKRNWVKYDLSGTSALGIRHDLKDDEDDGKHIASIIMIRAPIPGTPELKPNVWAYWHCKGNTWDWTDLPEELKTESDMRGYVELLWRMA